MKASLASATSVVALLALEAVHTSGVLVTIGSSAVGVAAVTLADVAPAMAGPITVTGATTVGGTFVGGVGGGTLTIYDLVDGATTTGSRTLTFTATNSAGSDQTITNAGFTITSPGTLTGSSVSVKINKGATGSGTATYTFRAVSIGAQSTTATYTFAGSGNSNATVTIVGSGVAPVAGVSVTNPYVLVNNATSGVQVTITNAGNGNLAPLSVNKIGVTANNLNGSISTASGFTGGGTTVSLGDAFGGPASSKTFTFAPTSPLTSRGDTVKGSAIATFSNGVGVTNGTGSQTVTLTGTGVAPVNAVSASSTVYARLGTSASATVSVSNVGDGNLSGAGTISNLNGTISTSLGTGFTAKVGNPTSVSLADSASTTLGFTFTPVSKGTSSTTTTFSFANGNSSGSNLGQTVSATVSAQGVGPQLQSTFGVVNTPTAVPNGATAASGPTISFGSVGYGISTTVYLELANITTDPNGGNDALTNLTLNSFTIAGVDASKFSVGLPDGTVITKGSTVYLPITVLSTTLGALSSTLTIFTDQSVALGGIGDTFTYTLYALVPEPSAIVLSCTGLAGLALLRRRNRSRLRQQERARA